MGDHLKKILSPVSVCNENAYAKGCIPEYEGMDTVALENDPDADTEYILRNCPGFTQTSILNKNVTWVLKDGTILGWYNYNIVGYGPLIYVDINGKESPNKVDKEQQEKVYPDIVPFAITTRGETIPMGYPIYSNMYLTAKIGYPAAEINGVIVDNRFSKTMSFFEAIQGAWGGAISPDIPFSIPFTEELPDTNLAKSFFLGQVPESAEFKSQEGCKGGEYTCRVVIDSYIDKRF